MDLKDKRALITGGTSGMGIGAARSMAEKGASVILTGRDETRGVPFANHASWDLAMATARLLGVRDLDARRASRCQDTLMASQELE